MTTYPDLPPEPPEDDHGYTPPDPASQPPQSRSAEQALLGSIMNEPVTATQAATLIDREDFYYPHHQVIWDAIHAVTATGALAEATLVLDHLTRNKEIRSTGGAPYLFELVQAGRFGQIEQYAWIVRDAARLRTAYATGTRIRQAVATARPENVDQALAEAVTTLDETYARHGATRAQRRYHVETIDELLEGDGDDDSYDWVIPDLIEHQERVIITAEEGAGKSTLLRQIAIQAAAGIHPFTHAGMKPITVLHVDVENTRRQSRRRYRPMRIQAGHALNPENLRIELRTAGLDLTTEADRDWLLDTARHVKPDLLLIGPIYKLANGDPTEEKSAKPVAMAIDAVRDQTDCAVILEAHAAKAAGGQRKRPHEPYGWSGWLRWPEVGLWLDKTGELHPWRGAREERAWPDLLERGGTWPWSAGRSEAAEKWHRIQEVRRAFGAQMSYGDLVEATGISKPTLSRLIGMGGPYAGAWTSLNEGTKEDR